MCFVGDSIRFHHFNNGSAKHTHEHKERINAPNSGTSFWQAAITISHRCHCLKTQNGQRLVSIREGPRR